MDEPSTGIPIEVEIAKLARLGKLAYAQQRKEAALRLGTGLRLLDELVAEARAAANAAPAEIGGGMPFKASEDEVARAFAQAYAGKIVFDHTAQKWFTWTGTRWQRDETDAVFFLAREYCRDAMGVLAATAKIPPDHMGRINFCANVERAARSDPRLAVTFRIWDTDPWLLGVLGGVIDLRTGETLPPDPARYISRETSVAPAPPGTDAPIWRAFLHDATGGDAEFEAFLQRLCGYLLTGCVNEEILTFFYGTGGTGKGTFLRAVTRIFGDYAVALPIEVFTAEGRLNLEYYRAKMAGRRLITSSEPEANTTWSEAQIRELTGNETKISARHPYGQPFEFDATAKLAIVGNHAPKLKGRTREMERRLRVAPFDNIPAKVDETLKDRLSAEYPAILRWMIDGALLWQRQGIGTCQAVRRASEEYFERQDAFRQWADECCVLDPSLSTRPATLLAAFNTWAKAAGRDQTDANTFAEIIARTPGLRRGKWQGVRLVRGIGVKATLDDRGEP